MAENAFNSVERVQEYSDLESEAEEESDNPPPADWPQKGQIVFENVKARYRSDLPPVLKGLNFSINPGENVGICGRTGAGKSSTFLTLFRIIEVEEGGAHHRLGES